MPWWPFGGAPLTLHVRRTDHKGSGVADMQLARPARLDAIAEHLENEIKMPWAAGAEVPKGRSWVLHNAAVESFALHARNVIDFFYTRPKKEDVVVGHFFGRARAWDSLRPPLTATLKRAKDRADREVSHLTYTRIRVREADKPWPVREITRDIQAVIDVFVQGGDWVPSNIKTLRYRELLP